MIKTLIFDFGDVFINLDKEAPYIEMRKLGIHSFSNEMVEINKRYETGIISTSAFLDFYCKICLNTLLYKHKKQSSHDLRRKVRT